jgi:hypothetical protein
VKDLNGAFLHAVRNDVRQSLMQQFTRTFIDALAPAMGEFFERPDGLVNLCDGGMSQMRMVFFQVLVNAF